MYPAEIREKLQKNRAESKRSIGFGVLLRTV